MGWPSFLHDEACLYKLLASQLERGMAIGEKEPRPDTQTRGQHSTAEFQSCEPLTRSQFFVSSVGHRFGCHVLVLFLQSPFSIRCEANNLYMYTPACRHY